MPIQLNKKLLLILFSLITSFFLLLGLFIFLQVQFGNTKYLEKTAILSKIREETTIYYADEKTQMGSIFDTNHREYTPISEVPKHFLDAIVAAEDKNFYEHNGVDFTALSKAFLEALMSRRFTRGGSSITQQTVKNIVNDWEPSFTRKFREMIRALQLERLYSKQQILEFYINQFYVVRNGNGVGIAARYYFNKRPSELDLVESAFIVGSLKGPGKYNPFVKDTKEKKEQAIVFALDRKNYVLKRMLEQKWISKEVYEEAKNKNIPFNQGDFSNFEIALVGLIKEQLNKKDVLTSIGLSSKEDLNIAGYKIYSTIDEKLQNHYQRAMRQNLSRVETILSEFTPEKKQNFKPLNTLEVGSFVYGKIETITSKSSEASNISLSFGFPKGTLVHASLVDQAKLMALSGRHSEQDRLNHILNSLHVGDVLFCEVKSYNKETHSAELLLRRTPRVSGGLIAIDKGEVKALISGFDALGYNRALFAKRQPGSLFKSLLFYGALQLGWTVTDNLNNVRKVFPYQGNLYAPRPDHPIQYESSSLLWTGVMSENIAAVNLLEDFLDKLNFNQFQKVMTFLGLSPRSGESESDFHYRLSKETGVFLEHEGIKEHLLAKAIRQLIPDLIFEKEENTIRKLKELWWGKGHQYALSHLENLNKEENKVKAKLLENNFLHLKKNYSHLHRDWQTISEIIGLKGLEGAYSDQSIFKILAHFRVIEKDNKKQLAHYTTVNLKDFVKQKTTKNSKDENLGNRKTNSRFSPMIGRELTLSDLQDYWQKEASVEQAPPSNTLLHSYLTVEEFQRLNSFIENELATILSKKEKYSLNKYYHHHDFRIALSLSYLMGLAKESGVSSPLTPVMSLALGSSEVTVGEVAKLYQTFINGKTYSYNDDGPKNQLNFIKRVEDRFGNIIYEPTRTEHQLTQDSINIPMREILRKTMTHGTGRRSRDILYVTPPNSQAKIKIPTFGKTGTTNDFTTSYFAGSMPYPVKFGEHLDTKNSYTVAAYIGYDDNTHMQKGSQKIYGASGAMPLWIESLREIIRTKEYKSNIDPFDISLLSGGEWPLKLPRNTRPYLIDLPRGITLKEGKEADNDIYRQGDEKTKNGYYKGIYKPDLGSSSILYLPESREQKISLFNKK